MTGRHPDQVTDEQLKSMTPEQIDQAHRDGRLDDLLGVEPRQPIGDGQVTDEQLKSMTPEEIVQAGHAGRLETLLAGPPEKKTEIQT